MSDGDKCSENKLIRLRAHGMHAESGTDTLYIVVYGRCLGKFEQRLQGRKRASQADMLEEEGEGRDRI